MLDIKYIRDNFDEVQARARLRDKSIDLSPIEALDTKRRRKLLGEVEALKQKRNEVSKEIARLKKEKADADALVAEMQGVSKEIKALDARDLRVRDRTEVSLCSRSRICFTRACRRAPMIPRTVLRGRWEKSPPLALLRRSIMRSARRSGLWISRRAAKLAGARFSLLTGAGALLERALINFMLDMHTGRHGYIETQPPFMVGKDCYIGTGQLPKFADDLFKIEGWDHYLVPTAEVPLTNIHAGEILKAEDLPVLYTAYTPCFRKGGGLLR